MESVEFYAELLYKAKQLGGAKEFDNATVQRLYEIRRQMGLPGKHPANLCQNKNGMNCHNCGGNCGEHAGSITAPGGTAGNEALVAQITKKVMEQMGL